MNVLMLVWTDYFIEKFVFQETEAVYKLYAQRVKVALIIFIKALHVMVAPRKGIQDSLGLDSTLWIPDSRFQVLDSRLFVSGSWRGFQDLYSGFQNPGFQIPPAKISQIPESGFPFIGGLWNRKTAK